MVGPADAAHGPDLLRARGGGCGDLQRHERAPPQAKVEVSVGAGPGSGEGPAHRKWISSWQNRENWGEVGAKLGFIERSGPQSSKIALGPITTDDCPFPSPVAPQNDHQGCS